MGGIFSSIWPSGIFFWLISGGLGFVSLLLLALSISSFLYQLAELAEEYPTLAGHILRKYLLPTVCGAHILIWFDGIPFTVCTIGLACHFSYYLVLRTYPLISPFSPTSIASAIAVLICHWNWLKYFEEIGTQQRASYDGVAAPGMGRISMLHMIGFFLLFVWAVPAGIFISMTVNDNVLPGVIGGNIGGNKENDKGKGSNAFKAIYDRVSSYLESIADRLYVGASSNWKNSPSSSSSSSSASYGSNFTSASLEGNSVYSGNGNSNYLSGAGGNGGSAVPTAVYAPHILSTDARTPHHVSPVAPMASTRPGPPAQLHQRKVE